LPRARACAYSSPKFFHFSPSGRHLLGWDFSWDFSWWGWSSAVSQLLGKTTGKMKLAIVKVITCSHFLMEGCLLIVEAEWHLEDEEELVWVELDKRCESGGNSPCKGY
jgi:hypothetical protein